MNRNEAFEKLKQGYHITHPILNDAKAGPIYMEGDKLYSVKDGLISSEWIDKIYSKHFCEGWIVCNENGSAIESDQ